MGRGEEDWKLAKENTRVCTGSTLQLVLVIQQAVPALDALERIVGLILLVEAKVVLVGLFVLELLNVSLDDDADVWERGIRWVSTGITSKLTYRAGTEDR